MDRLGRRRRWRGLGWDNDDVESLMSERDESLRRRGLGWDSDERCGLGWDGDSVESLISERDESLMSERDE